MIYSLTVGAETPISFREGRSTAETATLPYIPGGALLASLVRAHQFLHRKTDELEALFMQESTCIGNLYPASFGEKPKPLQSDRLPVYPLPNTARSCKRFGGFLFDAIKLGEHHGAHDHLLYWSVFALSGETKSQLLDQNSLCQHQFSPGQSCGEAIDRFTGFYRRGKQVEQWGKPASKEILRTRTGINRATGAVEQGILYSRSMLAEQSSFWGTIRLADDKATSFEEFLQEASEAGLIRVGNNRSRGLGKIKVIGLRQLQEDTTSELADRISTFDTRLRQAAQAQGVSTPHALYLPLTLTSDAIISDHLLRDCLQLSPAYLADSWDIQGAALIYSNSGTRQVMGWNDLWRLPKADNLVITMGSVFLFGLDRPLDQTLLQMLLQMQGEGLGNRRREGFGQLMVANPFHWEVNNV
ncbi:MAG: hypothetical protein KJ077_22275 [Anaerolineae bacterium]|nr:hypothetical protein [Anaerolineae bacterium]